MRKLSTGDDSTLGNYLRLTEVVFGKESKATKYIEDKIKEEGPDSEVIADEGQMVHLLANMDFS